MEYSSRNPILNKQRKKLFVITLLVTTAYNLVISPLLHQANAQTFVDLNLNAVTSTLSASDAAIKAKEVEQAELQQQQAAEAEAAKPKRVIISSANRSVSAYNVGDVSQTDGDACTAANGENACEALKQGYSRCAANFVPFGTVLNVEGYGECLVTDRMNARYPTSVDIAMKKEDRAKAMQWGRRTVTVDIVKYQATETIADTAPAKVADKNSSS
ncbi:MAG: hypothetical protein PHW95_05670 [Patescibacteria group bacterium]|nr:hypothetical protein [Patescibacteria group bacterium]